MKIRIAFVAKLCLLSFLFSFIVFHSIMIPSSYLSKIPQFVTIFTSIVIQALPFVLIGVFGSALMQNIVTTEMIEKKLSRTPKLPGILMAIGAGFFFPVCDCGVIPVARRMLMKRVPPFMAIAYLVTAPLVNPITIWATATAFGYSLPVTLIRVCMAIGIGILVAWTVSGAFPTLEDMLNRKALQELDTAVSKEISHCGVNNNDDHKKTILSDIFDHANEEFIEVGKFLIIGAIITALVQTLVPRNYIVIFTHNPVLSVMVMMLLALSLSLCAEADAFVARAFTYHFSLGSVMAFMVFGQMIDIKNTALLLKSFKLKAILVIFGLCGLLVLILCTFMNILPIQNLMLGRL